MDVLGVSVLWGIFTLGALTAFVMLWLDERRMRIFDGSVASYARRRRVRLYALGAVFCWLWPVSALAGLVYWLTSTALWATLRALFVDAFGKGAAK